MKPSHLIITTALFLGTSAVALANSDHHASHGNHQQHQTEQLIQTTGVIKQIDLTSNKVTITHEPIPELSWPAMTMRFTAEDQSLINQLKVNDKVRFEFVQQGNISLLRSITVIQ